MSIRKVSTVFLLSFYWFCIVSSANYSYGQKLFTKEQLEKIWNEGVKQANWIKDEEIRKVNRKAEEIKEAKGFPKEPVLNKSQSPVAGVKIRENKQFKAQYKKELAEYEAKIKIATEEQKKLTEKVEKKINEINEKLDKWVFPIIRSNSEVSSIGLLLLSRRVSDEQYRKIYYRLEFKGPRDKDSSEFWVETNTWVFDNMPNKLMATGHPYSIDRPVVMLEPTEPERYLHFKMLTDEEILEIKQYVEEKTEQKYRFEWLPE